MESIRINEQLRQLSAKPLLILLSMLCSSCALIELRNQANVTLNAWVAPHNQNMAKVAFNIVTGYWAIEIYKNFTLNIQKPPNVSADQFRARDYFDQPATPTGPGDTFFINPGTAISLTYPKICIDASKNVTIKKRNLVDKSVELTHLDITPPTKNGISGVVQVACPIMKNPITFNWLPN